MTNNNNDHQILLNQVGRRLAGFVLSDILLTNVFLVSSFNLVKIRTVLFLPVSLEKYMRERIDVFK